MHLGSSFGLWAKILDPGKQKAPPGNPVGLSKEKLATAYSPTTSQW
jgi:hypothetical protein